MLGPSGHQVYPPPSARRPTPTPHKQPARLEDSSKRRPEPAGQRSTSKHPEVTKVIRNVLYLYNWHYTVVKAFCIHFSLNLPSCIRPHQTFPQQPRSCRINGKEPSRLAWGLRSVCSCTNKDKLGKLTKSVNLFASKKTHSN